MDIVYLKELLANAAPLLTSYVLRVLGVLFVVWLAFKVAGWLGDMVARQTSARVDQAVGQFLGSMVKSLVIASALIACLGVFGIETTTFAALLGSAGLAIGLAFQGTLANFAAGIMLLAFKPFKIGHVVKVDGVMGTVVDIGLFVTSFDTPDNRRIIMPNKAITNAVVENISHHERRRVDIDVGVDYRASVAEVRALLDEAIGAVEGRDEELGHQIVLLGLGASSVDWQVRVWCNATDFLAVKERATEAVKVALDGAGVGIPFPQLDVHVDEEVKKLFASG